MKKLIMIGGTMGVGKTATSQLLKKELDHCVFLDGDWCWDMDPFIVNKETKEMVMNNIVYILNNFIHCQDIENIIFCWVMHEQTIIDELISRIDAKECQVYSISLISSSEKLQERIQKDIDLGIRTVDVLERSLKRLEMYSFLNTKIIDTSNLSIKETVKTIQEYLR